MKRIIIAAIATALAFNGFAQPKYIEFHKVLDDGTAIAVKTKPAVIKEKGQADITISLMYETVMKENASMSGYSLFIRAVVYRDDWMVPLNGKLLIRTVSGKVISLSQSVPNGISMYSLYNGETGRDNVDYNPQKYIGYDSYRGATIYEIFGKYPIREGDLKSIVEEGIVKIRMETTGSNIECEYPAEEDIRSSLFKKTHGNVVKLALAPYYDALIINVDPHINF